VNVSNSAFKLPVLRPRRPDVPAQKEHLAALGAECWRCPLARNPAVPTQWSGAGSPPLALVGEAPGKREVQARMPFVGMSGKVLNYACQQAGVDRTRLAVLNAIACGPIPSEMDAVKRAAADACRPRLISELRALKPRGVLALGAYALRAVAPPGSSGITVLRGAKLGIADDVKSPAWEPEALFATFHPAHIARGGDGDEQSGDKSVDALYYFLLFDLAKAWRFVHGEAKEWAVDADLFVDVEGRLVRVVVENNVPRIGDWATGEELRAALGRVYEEARAHGSLTCDTETDHIDSLRANLTAIGYGTPEGGLCATWAAYNMHEPVQRLLLEMHRARLRWNWQNGIYDRVVLNRHRILGKSLRVFGNHEDTLLSHHAAFPGLPHKLDSIASQFHVVTPWKNEFRTSTRNTPELVWYCVNDVVMTARLEPAIKKHVRLAKTERVYEADRQLNVVATEMRIFGCYIDRTEQERHRAVQTSRMEYMKVELAREMQSIEQPFREALARLMADKQRKNDPDSYLERVEIRYREIAERDRKPTDIGFFKPKSKLDLVALFNVLKIPVKAWTKTGLPVTDKKAMDAAAARHPLMRRVIHLREAQHLIANYVDLPITEDGRMHPDWKTNKITGRWGAGRSQNVPNDVSSWPPRERDGKFVTDKNGDYVCDRDNLRSVFTAPTAQQILEVAARGRELVDPIILARAKQGFGRMLVGADEDQVELRIVGFLAREPFLLNIFNEGRDPHSEFAREVIFPREFPKIEQTIKDSGFKPKATQAVEDVIAKLADKTDTKSYEQREYLRDVRRAQAGWKRLRDLSKRVEYGSIYRGEAPTLWESIVKDFPEVQLTDVEKFLRQIHEAMPAVVSWWNECDEYARRNREIREPWLGRVRLFPLGNFDPTVAVNFPVQAYNAGLMATATFRLIALTQPSWLDFEPLFRMRLLDAKWLNARRDEGFAKWRAPTIPILQVHDSLVCECDEEDADQLVKLLTLCMDQEDYNARYDARIRYTGEAHKSRKWSKT
jgi:DNA polymerase